MERRNLFFRSFPTGDPKKAGIGTSGRRKNVPEYGNEVRPKIKSVEAKTVRGGNQEI